MKFFSKCIGCAAGIIFAAVSISCSRSSSKKIKTDVAIIGGGGAGMSAVIRARQLGLNVVLVEKMSFLGGAISISGGNQVVMGSDLQKKAGVSDDSAESMIEDFKANGAGLNIDELIKLYADHVGETSDWLSSYAGVNYNVDAGLHTLAEYKHNRELAYVGGGAGAGKALREAVEKSKAKVLLNTRAEKLLTDKNGTVAGIEAKDDKGITYTITAKAVLLATGGYGNNKDLLTEEMRNALYYGPVSSTGDGIIMATADPVKAATRLMQYGKRYPNGIEIAKGLAKSTINGNYAAYKLSGILINKAGNRIVNEKASNRTVLEAEIKQDGQMAYLFMDAETFEAFSKNLSAGGISANDISKWVASNGSTTPVFAHADTINALASQMNINPETIKNTVALYNSFVVAKSDKAFGRSPDYMTKTIGNGPYYMVEQKPRFATTMGGLVVTTSLEVQNTDGQTIPGLYAAGEIVGGVMGDDSPSGANNGWALTSGKLAAEAIATKLGK